MAYTKAEIEALKNTLLASGQPIPASVHRTFEQVLIDEMFDAQSRGDLLAGLTDGGAPQSGDIYFVLRGGLARRVSAPSSSIDRVTLSTAANLAIDMASKAERVFIGSASFNANKSVSFSNASGMIRATVFLTITAGNILTFPANVQYNLNAAGWSTNTWTCPETGKYRFDILFDGTNYDIDVFGPRGNA